MVRRASAERVVGSSSSTIRSATSPTVTAVRPEIALVDKPVGPTSHDVVQRIRRLAGTRRVGHAGTLDPGASGLLIAGIELQGRPGKPSHRAMAVLQRCFDAGLLIRTTGDIVALSPPLIIERPHVDRIVETLGEAIRAEAA